MLEVLALLLAAVRAALCSRRDLVVENALLRHQFRVLTRPTRKQPRVRLRDKVVWLPAHLPDAPANRPPGRPDRPHRAAAPA